MGGGGGGGWGEQLSLAPQRARRPGGGRRRVAGAALALAARLRPPPLPLARPPPPPRPAGAEAGGAAWAGRAEQRGAGGALFSLCTRPAPRPTLMGWPSSRLSSPSLSSAPLARQPTLLSRARDSAQSPPSSSPLTHSSFQTTSTTANQTDSLVRARRGGVQPTVGRGRTAVGHSHTRCSSTGE